MNIPRVMPPGWCYRIDVRRCTLCKQKKQLKGGTNIGRPNWRCADCKGASK